MERSLLLQETPDVEISRKVCNEYLLHSTIDGHSSELFSRDKHCLYYLLMLSKKTRFKVVSLARNFSISRQFISNLHLAAEIQHKERFVG